MAAAVKVAAAVHRMEQGTFSNLKGVGAGIYEQWIDFGPGLSDLLRQGWNLVVDLACGWHQEAPGRGYSCRKRALARL